MNQHPASNHRRIILAVMGLVLLAGLGAAVYFLWLRPKELPGADSPLYQEYAEAFQLGTAAVDANQYNLALKNLTDAIDKIPAEPAAWANRGILHMRNQEEKKAGRDLKKAHELASNSPEIESLLGVLANKRGAIDQAVAHFRKVVEKNPQDLGALFALAKQIETTGDDAEYQRLLEAILRVQPSNLFVLWERAQVATRRRDVAALKETLARLGLLSGLWKANTLAALEDVKKAAAGPLPGTVPEDLVPLKNLMAQELGYTRGAEAVKFNSKDNEAGETLQHFVLLEPLRKTPAPADFGMTFAEERLGGAAMAGSKWDVILPVWLTGECKPAVFTANALLVHRIDAGGFEQPFPSGPQAIPPSYHGVLALDWNNDSRMDLLLAGSGGLRFWQQNENGSFTDVTAKTGLDASILGADYFGAWAADYEMDGDLDIVLASRAGPPLVFRNNRDGTYKVVKPFAGAEAVRAFVWADLDNDGTPDAAFLDAKGKLHVFMNERLGQFQARTVPEKLGRLTALTAADLDDDGVLDLATLQSDGAVLRISDRDKGKSWDTGEAVRWAEAPADAEPGTLALIAGDLDNNGGLDLLAAGPNGHQIWLNEEPGKFTVFSANIKGRIFAAEDLRAHGRLDLLGFDKEGLPARQTNHGTRSYMWLGIRAVAASGFPPADQRINSFAIGSEVEMRIGTLVQKQVINSPCTHFGLGDRKNAHVVRFVWTNGYPQSEFQTELIDLTAGKAVRIEQRLKGSCPFLFTDDGKGMQFVTDFLWSTPLGMFIGGQDKGGFLQTQDWVKIRGDLLAPRDGKYDVRVQANLWETHFFDHMSLIVADHPPDTEVFVDERFALTPMTPAIHATSTPRPVAKAWDHNGKDVTELVRTIDARYLDTCGRGEYQGITRDHWVEADLGDEAPREGAVWLLAHGWIHPTDSSINVAISQGKHDSPRPLVLEVPDGKGGWKVGRPALGFPAGKNKTVMIRLDGIPGVEGVARRFRLRTNMEIFWDALHYATARDAGVIQQKRLAPETAVLRYRGILDMTRANDSSPELPHYDKVARSGQRWRDLIGYHTRHGDVLELLEKIDDRYAIVNAGDEIAMKFTAPPSPPAGWKRDFVWVGEGWVKDGDMNTAFSKTVLPLPAHDMTSYDRRPGALEDDPVYKRFPGDWKKYHTRYVTPSTFERGLRSFQRPRP